MSLVAVSRVSIGGQVEVSTFGQIIVPPRVRRVDQELRAPMVTVKAPTNRRHHRGLPLKSAKDRMDIISAYYSSGHTAPPLIGAAPPPDRQEDHRQVRSRQVARRRGPNGRITSMRWPSWSPNAWRNRRHGFRPSGCCRLLVPRATKAPDATSGAWSPTLKRCGANITGSTSGGVVTG